MASVTYTLSKSLKRRMEKSGRIMVCSKCNENIKVGEPVVSKTTRRVKWYHPTLHVIRGGGESKR